MQNKACQLSPTALVGNLFSGRLCGLWLRCRRAEAVGLAALKRSAKKMAIYYNLGVDCGSDEAIADLVVSHFENYHVDLPGVAPVEFRLSKTFERSRWYVGACSVGLSHGSPMGDRPEIVNDEMLRIIDYLGMIFSVAEFGSDPPGLTVENFSTGLKRVTETRAEQGVDLNT